MPEIKEAAEKAAQKAKTRKRRIFVEVALLSFCLTMVITAFIHYWR